MQKLLILAVCIATSFAASIHPKDGKRLIQTSENEPARWLDQSEIANLILNDQGFMDITDFDYSGISTDNINVKSIPKTLRFNSTVRNVINRINTRREEEFLTTLTNFLTRYYASPSGRASQLFIYGEADASLRGYPGNSTAFEVDHGFLQRSVVARLEGEDPTLKEEVVIIGAHQDSINGQNHTGRSPGADDNGAGSTAVLEALRVIVEAGITFKRTVEFHWYAAEEMGLWGAQAIAQDYNQRKVNVVGMLNMDVISHKPDNVNEIALVTDNGSEELQDFLRLLVAGYLNYGLMEKSCGYACSDHAAWHRNGFPAVAAFEAVSESNRHHTINDTMDAVNFEALSEFVKLSVSLIVEQAEPVNPL